MIQTQQYVVVRIRTAGVHIGTLVEWEEQCVTLSNARRIWRWRGANTLHEVALHGVDDDWSRISEAVDSIALLDAIEVIPCADSARTNLDLARWGK